MKNLADLADMCPIMNSTHATKELQLVQTGSAHTKSFSCYRLAQHVLKKRCSCCTQIFSAHVTKELQLIYIIFAHATKELQLLLIISAHDTKELQLLLIILAHATKELQLQQIILAHATKTADKPHTVVKAICCRYNILTKKKNTQ